MVRTCGIVISKVKIDMPPRRRRSRGPGRVLTGATGLGTGAIVISAGTGGLRRPTVKLRGREPETDLSRGRTMILSARGDATAHHGTLQRLLGGNGVIFAAQTR